MSHQEQFLYVSPCRGALQNLKEPVTVSVGFEVERCGLSVGCPFAKKVDGPIGHVIKCTAPSIATKVTRSRALPNCYHMERKVTD